MPDTIDFSNVKAVAIPEGDVIRIEINGVLKWKAQTYTNQVPISTDTDGSIFNGVGYKENVRLSSSGGISSSAQNGSVTTGFIPFKVTDVMRLKGVEWVDTATNGHHYFNYYDANKNFLAYMSASMYNHGEQFSHIFTATRDANGVETVVWNNEYGTTNATLQAVRQASYVRITARGKGADMIVTMNEEIT